MCAHQLQLKHEKVCKFNRWQFPKTSRNWGVFWRVFFGFFEMQVWNFCDPSFIPHLDIYNEQYKKEQSFQNENLGK